MVKKNQRKEYKSNPKNMYKLQTTQSKFFLCFSKNNNNNKLLSNITREELFNKLVWYQRDITKNKSSKVLWTFPLTGENVFSKKAISFLLMANCSLLLQCYSLLKINFEKVCYYWFLGHQNRGDCDLCC